MTVTEYVHRGIDWGRPHDDACNCGGSYKCPGCEREVGYCNGANDELEELCDDCACVVWRYRKMYGEAA